MAQTGNVTTAEQLFAMRDDGYRHELWHGELRRMSPPGFQHGWLALRLASRFHTFVEQHDLGVVVVEAGFLLARDPDHVRGPDVAFVRKERVPAGRLPVKYWPGAPDLAVEIVSPNDTYIEVHEKAEDLLVHGTRMVVVVEPERRRVVVHGPSKVLQVLTEEDELDGGDIVPGFRVAVRDLFGG